MVKNITLLAETVFMGFWLTLGAGIAMAIMRDNDTTADRVLMFGLFGCIYVGVTCAILMVCAAWYLDARDKENK